MGPQAEKNTGCAPALLEKMTRKMTDFRSNPGLHGLCTDQSEI
jgi:hypothetical protein